MADIVEIKYIQQISELAVSATHHACVPALYHLHIGKGKEDGKSQTVFIVLKSSVPPSPFSVSIHEHGIYSYLFRSALSPLNVLQTFFLQRSYPYFLRCISWC